MNLDAAEKLRKSEPPKKKEALESISSWLVRERESHESVMMTARKQSSWISDLNHSRLHKAKVLVG
jgi:hypothetical protein